MYRWDGAGVSYVDGSVETRLVAMRLASLSLIRVELREHSCKWPCGTGSRVKAINIYGRSAGLSSVKAVFRIIRSIWNPI